jgi:hypothetical protein
MTTRTEVLREGTRSGEKPLGLVCEPLPAPLPLTSRLVRVLRVIIEIPMRVLFHPWEELALDGSIALSFVGNDHTRDVGSSCKRFAE